MKGLKKNSILLLLITFVVLFFVVKDDFNAIVDILKNVNPLWVVVGFLTMAASLFFRSLGLREVITGYKFSYSVKKTFKLETMTAFFNGITPFSTGGQPMQVLLLKEDGVRMTKGTNIIMMNFILYQAALVLLGLIALFVNLSLNLFPNNPILSNLILIGFILNTAVMIGLLIICYARKFTAFMVRHIISFLSFCHLIKDKQKIKQNWEEKLADFHEGTVFISKNKMNAALGFVYQFIGLFLLYVIPLFTFYAMHDFESMNALEAVVSSAYTMIIGAFVPIPGGSGGIEFGYSQFVGNFAPATFVSASLLIWRLTTYYLPMIVGGVLFGIRKGDAS